MISVIDSQMPVRAVIEKKIVSKSWEMERDSIIEVTREKRFRKTEKSWRSICWASSMEKMDVKNILGLVTKILTKWSWKASETEGM